MISQQELYENLSSGRRYIVNDQNKSFKCSVYGKKEPQFHLNVSGVISTQERKHVKINDEAFDPFDGKKNIFKESNKNQYIPIIRQ